MSDKTNVTKTSRLRDRKKVPKKLVKTGVDSLTIKTNKTKMIDCTYKNASKPCKMQFVTIKELLFHIKSTHDIKRCTKNSMIKCSYGQQKPKTKVFVNGDEVHESDIDILHERMPSDPGPSKQYNEHENNIIGASSVNEGMVTADDNSHNVGSEFVEKIDDASIDGNMPFSELVSDDDQHENNSIGAASVNEGMVTADDNASIDGNMPFSELVSDNENDEVLESNQGDKQLKRCDPGPSKQYNQHENNSIGAATVNEGMVTADDNASIDGNMPFSELVSYDENDEVRESPSCTSNVQAAFVQHDIETETDKKEEVKKRMLIC